MAPEGGVAVKTTAAEVVRWLETLKITEGSRAGEPFQVLLFQRQLIKGILGHSTVAFSVARGNGKTAFMAAIGAAALDGPLKVPRGEITLVAASFKQAKKAFTHCLWFMKPIIAKNPRRWRITDNDHASRIEDRETGAYLWTIGSDPGKAHGLAPAIAICDEPAQWPTNYGPRMYAAIKTGRGKQPNSTLIAIGTRPDDRDHWFAKLLAPDSSAYKKVYAAPPSSSDFSLRAIRAANPMYDHIPELRQILSEEMKDAKAGGENLAMWRALRLNKGTPDTFQRELIVSAEDWRASVVRIPPPREGPVAVGFDLGGSSSMTAFAAYWPESGRLETYGAFPAVPSLAQRGKMDGVADRYVRMRQRGEIRTYPGKVTPVEHFLRDMSDLLVGEDVIGAVADRYRKAEAEQAMAEADIRWEMEWRGTSGTGLGMDGPSDIRAFQAEVLTGHLRVTDSLLLESSILESKIKRDPNGNPGLDKQRNRGRIDALQAAVLAVGLGRRWRLPSPTEHLVDRPASDYILRELYT